MQLIYSPASPYARCPRIIARLHNLAMDEIALHPFDNPPSLLQANPLAKVPCLILQSGQALFDSQVICRYLDHCGNGQLSPASDDWQGQTLLALVIGLMDSAVALRQEAMREQEGKRSAFWSQRFTNALERGLITVNRQLPADATTSLATIYLLSLLDYLDFRHPHLNWRQHRQLVSLHQHWQQADCIRQTMPQ